MKNMKYDLVATKLIAMTTELTNEEQEVIRGLRASGYHDSAISGMTGYCRATITKYAGKMPASIRNSYNIEHRLMRTSRYFANIETVNNDSRSKSDNVVYLSKRKIG